jgi:hypothetical protein
MNDPRYTPPSSTIADTAAASTPRQPRHVKIGVALLWLSLVS